MQSLPLLVVLCSATALAALDIGSPAPSLAGVTLVKGEAIHPLDSGSLSVVEFWATWCGPCLTTIPHLTAMQQAHPDIQVIGLSDEDVATVTPFVEDQGATMNYRVGIADPATYQAWMDGVQGIPHAVLVSGEGTVLWMGHPMGLEPVLTAALSGTLNVDHLKQVAAAEKDLEQALTGRSPDLPRAHGALAQILALDPVHERAIRLSIAIAKHEGDADAVGAVLAAIPIDRLSPILANGLAWEQAIETDLAYRHLDHALAFIGYALQHDPDNAAFIDTHARLLYALGLLDQAIAEQERACATEPGEPTLQATLEAYRAVQAIARQVSADVPTVVPAPAVIP